VDNPSHSGLSRRSLIRGGLLIGLGATVAVAALPELSKPALAEGDNIGVYILGDIYACQPDWWYCVNCYGVYHSDTDSAGGVCPDGYGPHKNDLNYTDYCIPFGGPSQTNVYGMGVQAGWYWCSKCQVLFWGNAQAESVCPDGGNHIVTSGAYQYDLPFAAPNGDGYPEFIWDPDNAISEDLNGQQDWLYCVKCRGLFYGHGSASDGVCPAGGAHQQYSGSSNYVLISYPITV
jgi:hypothetical protein